MTPEAPSLARYFDYNGSTPLAAPVQELCAELLGSTFGNSAAPHPEGRAASALVEAARAQIADLLGARPAEVLFTSGGTESNNQALFGTAALHPGGHLVVSAVEHKSVLNSALCVVRGQLDSPVIANTACIACFRPPQCDFGTFGFVIQRHIDKHFPAPAPPHNRKFPLDQQRVDVRGIRQDLADKLFRPGFIRFSRPFTAGNGLKGQQEYQRQQFAAMPGMKRFGSDF